MPLKITVPPFASNVTVRVLLFIKAPCIVRLAEEGALNLPAVIRKLFATVKGVFNVTWGATNAVLFNTKVPSIFPVGENSRVSATPPKSVVMFNVDEALEEKTPEGKFVLMFLCNVTVLPSKKRIPEANVVTVVTVRLAFILTLPLSKISPPEYILGEPGVRLPRVKFCGIIKVVLPPVTFILNCSSVVAPPIGKFLVKVRVAPPIVT